MFQLNVLALSCSVSFILLVFYTCGIIQGLSQNSNTTSQQPLNSSILQSYSRNLSSNSNIDQSTKFVDVAKVLYDSHNYSQAIQYLDKALAIDPDLPYALSLKGAMLVEMGRYHEGILWAEKALALDPNYFNALLTKGVALTSLRNYSSAITYLDKALAFNANDTLLILNKGNAFSGLGRYNEAMFNFDRVLTTDPKDATYCPALYGKGTSLGDLHRYNEATEYFDKILSICPKDPYWVYALYGKGISFAKLGMQDEAILNYDKALAIKPNYVDILHSKGWALFSHLRIPEAITTMFKAYTLEKNDIIWDSKVFAFPDILRELKNSSRHFYPSPFSFTSFNFTLDNYNKIYLF